MGLAGDVLNEEKVASVIVNPLLDRVKTEIIPTLTASLEQVVEKLVDEFDAATKDIIVSVEAKLDVLLTAKLTSLDQILENRINQLLGRQVK